MRFRRRDDHESTGAVDAASGTGESGRRHPCAGLTRVLEKVLQRDKPEILVLGPLCGETVISLAERGAKVHVEDPGPPPAPVDDDDESVAAPIRFDLPAGRFDLVLVWDQFDFYPPKALTEVGGEIVRLLRADGWVLAFTSMSAEPTHATPARYRILEEDVVVVEGVDGLRRQRYVHPNREIEKALRGLSVQGIHLQRNQVREFVAVKRAS